MTSSTLLKKVSLVALGASLTVAVVTEQAQAANFNVTIEAPGVQQSSLVTNPLANPATGVTVENFNSTSTGYKANFSSSLGTYSNIYIEPNKVWGGANGSQYVIPNGQSSLQLNSAQKYFGMWWSAGDPGNILDFYSGSTLVQSFNTADVINFLQTQPNTAAYYGNPNSNFQGLNGSEPYAFLNFYANSGITFDKIVFTETQFESDNHTVAASYGQTSGTSISQPVPESSATFSLLGLSALGLGSVLKRKQQQKTNNKV